MTGVQSPVAVVAAVLARGVAQQLYNVFDLGVVVQHPRRSYCPVVGGVDQSQCIRQSAGVSARKHADVGVLAYIASI